MRNYPTNTFPFRKCAIRTAYTPPLFVPLKKGGTAAAVVDKYKTESVGAIHESPAVGTLNNAPHQSLPLMRELAPQATEGEKNYPSVIGSNRQ